MVTTKGTSLNPNAKVWQEIPAQQNDVSSGLEESSSWMQAYSSPAEMTEGSTDGSSPDTKGYYSDYLDSTGDFSAVLPCTMQNVEQPGLGYLLFDAQSNSATDIEVCKEQTVTEESLRDTLKERLEFCFSRENLSKDLYLISQMDNDQFVPIWTVACMEDIQALTTDMDLILDVLKASPLVQVDEAGEKVRPNHSRCIIILREVPETTPLEEVEALFKNENCPQVLSAEFAHNSSWYITFQSDMDALKAYRYLREEVKTFQGKPVMARIKAINTFFGKNGFRSVDSGVYQQQAQQQAQFASPVYMQQVYSSQQQYPVYPVVSPTWSPPIVPHFETPLATFPNDGFMNGYSNNGSYKGNSSSVGGPRSTGRNRNHLKGPSRPEDVTPSTAAPATVINCISGPLSSQDVSSSKTPSVAASQSGSLSAFDLKATSSLASISSRDRMGRDRRSNHRGSRRKREDEQTLKPVPLMEVKAPPPNFDLAASSFPPLPGSVVAVHGEAVAEVRLSDVVRGLKTSTKTGIKEDKSSQNTKDSESHGNTQDPVSLEAKPTPVTVQTEAPQASSTITPAVKEDKPEPPKEEISTSTQPESAAASKQSPTTSNQSVSENPVLSSPTSEQAQRKLSYAEVCQRPAKDLPPATPATSDNQPLQELKVNTVEEVRTTLRQAPEKSGDKRSPRQPSRAFRGPPGHTRARGYGMKMRENQRGKWFSSQQGGKHIGKEQNIPPTSPK